MAQRRYYRDLLQQPNDLLQAQYSHEYVSNHYFQLPSGKHLSEDVAEFIGASMLQIRELNPHHGKPFLILDNSPKNRSASLFKMASQNLFLPVFITPGCPEQNFAESVFGTIKTKFSAERNLLAINQSENRSEEMLVRILMTLKNITEIEMKKSKRRYLGELLQTLEKAKVDQ